MRAVAFLMRLAVLWIEDSLESLASLVGGDEVFWPRAGCGILDLHSQIPKRNARRQSTRRSCDSSTSPRRAKSGAKARNQDGRGVW